MRHWRNQVNPGAGRIARAPYNFVPLPERVYAPGDSSLYGERGAPRHDEIREDLHSGYFECVAETLTPLFIRGPRRDGDTREARLRPEFYAIDEGGKPVLPGSSLRGMIRAVFEVLSYSKIQPVTDEKWFYRDLNTHNFIGQRYVDEMVTGNKIRAGFVRRKGGGWILEECEYFKVSRWALTDADQSLSGKLAPSNKPATRWWGNAQYRPCWFQTGGAYNDVTKVSFGSEPAMHRGTLVLTGTVPNKDTEWVFADPKQNAAHVEIPDAVWKRFHSDEQITQWQAQSFPKGKPGPRRDDGWLRDGEPVFFVFLKRLKSGENPNGLFFGRAGKFRLPYDLSPSDLCPQELRTTGPDLTDRVFGSVDTVGKQKAVRGRVRFTNAHYTGPHQQPLCDEVIVPKLLLSPKPSCYPLYLVQKSQDAQQLKTYFREHKPETEIRGTKFYWHKWDREGGLDSVKMPDTQQERHDQVLDGILNGKPDKTHTAIRCVKEGSKFRFRVYFENLSEVELGALSSAILLPGEMAHKIGTGKPLGLGSVELKLARLALIKGSERYAAWESTGVSGKADSDVLHQTAKGAFMDAILKHCADPKAQECPGDLPDIWDIPRLSHLEALLTAHTANDLGSVGDMEIGEFKHAPVLPLAPAVDRGETTTLLHDGG